MKPKIKIALLSLALLLSVTSSYAAAAVEKPSKEKIAAMTDEQKKVRLEEIKTRVEEIKKTDKSSLSRAERKALKKELREMNREAKAVRGVYLSVGAIIIIILLLILIL